MYQEQEYEVCVFSEAKCQHPCDRWCVWVCMCMYPHSASQCHCAVFADWLISSCGQISTLRLLTQALLCALDAWRASSTNIWARFILCWKWRHSYKTTNTQTHTHTHSPLLPSMFIKVSRKKDTHTHTHTRTHTVQTHLQRRRRFPHWGWRCAGSGKIRWRPHRALRGTADLHSWWGRYWRHAQHLYTQTRTHTHTHTHTRRRKEWIRDYNWQVQTFCAVWRCCLSERNW